MTAVSGLSYPVEGLLTHVDAWCDGTRVLRCLSACAPCGAHGSTTLLTTMIAAVTVVIPCSLRVLHCRTRRTVHDIDPANMG